MKKSKKVLNLKKETLVRLQEKQLQVLAGAAEMSNGGNTIVVTIDVPIGVGLAAEGNSCYKRTGST